MRMISFVFRTITLESSSFSFLVLLGNTFSLPRFFWGIDYFLDMKTVYKLLLILGGLLLIGVGFGQLNPEQRYENARWVSGEFVEMEKVRRGRWNNARYEIS